MFQIININGESFWQITEKLPRNIDNAIKRRYEKISKPLAVLLIIVYLGASLAIFLTVYGSIAANDKGMVTMGLLIGAIFLSITCVVIWETNERHRTIMSGLGLNRYPMSFMSSDDPIFRAIALPKLVEIMKVGPLSKALKSTTSHYFEAAKMTEEICEVSRLRWHPQNLEVTEQVYTYEHLLQTLAQDYLREIGHLIGTPAEDFIKEQADQLERNHKTELTNLVARLNDERTSLTAQIRQANQLVHRR